MAAAKVRRTATKRARKDDDKALRRKALINAARTLLGTWPYEQLSIERVAKAASLSKGTLYLYFATKEELFLAVLRELMDEWFEHIDVALGSAAAKLSAQQLVGVFAGSLGGRESLIGMLADVPALEQNLSFEAAMQHKLWLFTRLASTGARLELRFAPLNRAEGPRVLLHLYAVTVGMLQLTRTPPAVTKALAAIATEDSQRGFEEELLFVLTQYFAGLESRSGISK